MSEIKTVGELIQEWLESVKKQKETTNSKY
jgi:hypothetical protein